MVGRQRFKRNIEKIGLIIVIWQVIGIFLALFEHTVFSSIATDYDLSSNEDYNLWVSIKTYLLGAFIGGLSFGIIEFFYLSDKTRNYSFGKLLLIKSLIYVSLLLVLNIFASVFYNSTNLGLSPFHPAVIENSIRFLTNFGLIRNMVTWTIIIAATLVFLMINDKFGQGMMFKLILGRYNKPKEENRIFMFLDIRSSTTIAEKLGHLNYFELLKDFFSDITNAIIDRKGEIYQYVGDEVVISWTMKNGITDANCILSFFDVQKSIEKRSDRYMEKYGLVPGFKAGLHYGNATIGEIGVIKKEIVFSGDVLNTTSRIQEQCNVHGVDIMLSKRLFKLLPKLNSLLFSEIGNLHLRGKEDTVNLYTVQKVDKKRSKSEFGTAA